MIEYIHQNWVTILLATWTGLNFVMNGIASSLPAPTAQDSKEYTFWFKFVNYCALNSKRASGNAAIEQSPNFIPAAEAYMKKKLEDQQANKGN